MPPICSTDLPDTVLQLTVSAQKSRPNGCWGNRTWKWLAGTKLREDWGHKKESPPWNWKLSSQGGGIRQAQIQPKFGEPCSVKRTSKIFTNRLELIATPKNTYMVSCFPLRFADAGVPVICHKLEPRNISTINMLHPYILSQKIHTDEKQYYIEFLLQSLLPLID